MLFTGIGAGICGILKSPTGKIVNHEVVIFAGERKFNQGIKDNV